MCIIAGEVRRVAGTKLFVMPSSDGRRQITVYSNKVDTPGANVMCLPVPNPDSIAFETVYNDLFKDCKKSFLQPKFLSASNTLSFQDGGAVRSYLPVQNHGSYDVVVAPTLDDLDRVPPGFLTLSDDVKGYLRSNYTEKESPFGVLLCKLRPGSVEYEPFAYSHALLASGKLFVPTRHYHIESPGSGRDADSGVWGGAGVSLRVMDFSIMAGSRPFDDESPWLVAANRRMTSSIARAHRNSDRADDWDHEIYTALTPSTVAHNVSDRPPADRNAINWAKMPAAYQFGAAYPLRCFERIGAGPNEDLTFPIAVSA